LIANQTIYFYSLFLQMVIFIPKNIFQTTNIT
jgi:hypothetical protein